MLGNRLKEFRLFKKLTQQELAQKLNTSSGYISEIEANKKMPGSEFLLALLKEYKININWLLAGEGEMFDVASSNNISIKLQERYNLNDQEVELISELLISPEKRQVILRLLEDFKKF
ncbi:MAG: hypothetical protein A2287_01715 [Candidatus Melainabacteria bacterium RIFOXYA12_FULL_32_12]|nr:MAG: hypothetical protein A2255_01605 [Candidatus Melainabacteria bacterium RIFOXYA2_FULL_32_9]OGI28074.1 MAG: hypothetical protein A2287_01715 [Candidatus Melainabacteria bacterium RIFOXYA12_FULL_32_12]